MEKQIKILYRGGTDEVIEKKSRFIAVLQPIETEEQAQAFIEGQRKKYWDASHHCFAYVIGEHNEIARCSDDGEPAQTAGKPMLDVLLGEDVHNAVAVVTRYFGGTLLGTGGLVRAYTKAIGAGLLASRVVIKELCQRVKITSDYTALGKIQYIAGNMQLKLLDSVYSDIVETLWLVKIDDMQAFIKKVTEATRAQANIENMGESYAAFSEGDVLLFD